MSSSKGTRAKRILRNLVLISVGSVFASLSVKGIMMSHDFMVSGIFGFGMLAYYASGVLSPAIWYVIFCIPVGFVAHYMVSKRFFMYSLYAVAVNTLAVQLIPWPQIPISNSLLAAVAGGAIGGMGIGLTLRSQGSDGGLSIISIALHQRFGLRIGQVNFTYNLILFMLGLCVLPVDNILYSIIGMFIATRSMEYVASMFNERKVALIISDFAEDISKKIMDELNRGVTFIHGKGAFTGRERLILLAVVHNYQLKRLEDAVFSVDPAAFVIVENTFNVLGSGFSKRKIY